MLAFLGAQGELWVRDEKGKGFWENVRERVDCWMGFFRVSLLGNFNLNWVDCKLIKR